MKRAAMIALIGAATATAGCENMGLDYAGPEDEAQIAPSRDLVAAVTSTVSEWGGPELVVDGRLWVASELADLPGDDYLRPVGSASGVTVHARSWDRSPFDELFTRTAGTEQADVLGGGRVWLVYQPVIGGGGRNRPRGEAAAGH